MSQAVANEPADPLSRLLGFRVEETGLGFARVAATVGGEHRNVHGTVHGGFVFALADAAFSLASNSHGPRAMAVAASIHFARPARPGDVLVARAREVALGVRAASYEVAVEDRGSGRTVAVFTGTVFRESAERPPSVAEGVDRSADPSGGGDASEVPFGA